MQKQKYYSIVCFLSISLGTSAMAQRGGEGQHHYNGPDHGIQRSNDRGSNDNGCMEKYGKLNQPQLLNTCLMGATSAVQMASRYATSEGHLDGYRRGYAWGLRSQIDANINNPSQVIAGRSSVNSNDNPVLISKLSNANNAGDSAGTTAGTPNGDREAVTRFHNAIDTGVFPSKEVSIDQENSYNPQYQSPYTNPYVQNVGGIESEADLINDNRIDYSRVNPYQNYDRDLYGSQPQFDKKDFYRANGSYDFDRHHAEDGRKALDIWLDRSIFDRNGYSQLGSVTVITGYKTQVVTTTIPGTVAAPAATPAPTPTLPGPSAGNGGGHQGGGNGGQGGGHQGGGNGGQGGGHQGGGNGGVAVSTPTPAPTPVTPVVSAPTTSTTTVQVPITETYDLKQVFAEGFEKSYEKTAPYFYSNAFNDSLDIGDDAGSSVGVQVGQRLAYQNGQVSEFNNEFRQRESGQFWISYQDSFKRSFNSTYQRYATQPQLGVDSFTIKAARNDGFIEPGESFTANFVVRNYGGVDANIQTTLDGNVVNPSTRTLRVKALTTSRQVGTLTAAIDPNVPSQTEANIVLKVDNSSYPLQQYVTRQITVTGSDYSVDASHGNVVISTGLKNNSSVKSYDAIKMVITDSAGHAQTSQIGFIDAGPVAPIAINLSGYNALDLIDGKVSFQIDTYLGSLKVGTSSVAVKVGNTNYELARAFDAIAQGSGAVSVSDITNRIYSLIREEAINSGRTGYADQDNSLLSNLVNVKKNMPQSAAARAEYKKLARVLSPIENEMKKALIRIFKSHSDNQTYFEGQMKALQE